MEKHMYIIILLDMVAILPISRMLPKDHVWPMMVHIGMGKTGVDGVRRGSRPLMITKHGGPSSNVVCSGPGGVCSSAGQLQYRVGSVGGRCLDFIGFAPYGTRHTSGSLILALGSIFLAGAQSDRLP